MLGEREREEGRERGLEQRAHIDYPTVSWALARGRGKVGSGECVRYIVMLITNLIDIQQAHQGKEDYESTPKVITGIAMVNV